MESDNAAMYSEAHKSYDWTNHFLSFFADSSMREKAAKEVLSSNPERIIEIATGTGDTAIAIAKLAAKESRKIEIIAMDANVDMLSVAAKKAAFEKTLPIDFEKGDALNLNYPDGYFDAVVCTFSTKNFSNLDRFAGEANRILKQKGRLVIADMSRPDGTLNRAVFNVYLVYMKLIGTLAGKKLYRWLSGSTSSFNRSKFLAVLSKNRFSKPTVTEFFFGIAYIISCAKQ